MNTPMGKLRLSVAVGDYDRTRALLDGAVVIDGVDPVFMTLTPEEMFFRAFRHKAFDVCELSLSSQRRQGLALARTPTSACRCSCRARFATRRSRVRRDRHRPPRWTCTASASASPSTS